MSDPRSISPSDDWVRNIADAVRDLVREHGVERFREIVQQWKTERDTAPIGEATSKKIAYKADLPLLRIGDDDGKTVPKTMAEKYVVLAVIHDGTCLETEPIDPWREHRESWNLKRKHLKAAIELGAGYWAMVEDVKQGRLQGHEYEDDYRRELLAVLEDVRKDLASVGPIGQAEEAAGTGKPLTREGTLNLPGAPSEDFNPLADERIKDAVKEALTEHAKETGDVQSKPAKRPKKGDEKWRRAQKRLLDRLERNTLPKTIRDAAKAIEFKYGTTRRAVKKSATLGAYFGIASDTENSAGNPSSVLDELAQQADPETRKLVQEMAPERRKEAEAACQDMPPERRVEFFKALTSNPDTKGKLHGMTTLDSDEQDPTSEDYVRKGARRRERRAGSRREDD